MTNTIMTRTLGRSGFTAQVEKNAAAMRSGPLNDQQMTEIAKILAMITENIPYLE